MKFIVPCVIVLYSISLILMFEYDTLKLMTSEEMGPRESFVDDRCYMRIKGSVVNPVIFATEEHPCSFTNYDDHANVFEVCLIKKGDEIFEIAEKGDCYFYQ